MIGVDLGNKNLAMFDGIFARIYTENTEVDFLTFCDGISRIVSGEIIFVDFDWRLNYWPGNKQTKTKIIFLAAVLYMSAYECTFVSPNEIRNWLGVDSKTSKAKMHIIAEHKFPEIAGFKTSHEKDAYLLYYWGKENG